MRLRSNVRDRLLPLPDGPAYKQQHQQQQHSARGGARGTGSLQTDGGVEFFHDVLRVSVTGSTKRSLNTARKFVYRKQTTIPNMHKTIFF